MCGIWFYFSMLPITKAEKERLYMKFMQITARGPDYHKFDEINEKTIIGFHRLSIMDTSTKGHQPFYYEDDSRKIVLTCNGEIYEHEKLREKYSLHLESHSDCAVLLPLYMQLGISGLLEEIKSSEFAIIIYDYDKSTGSTTVTMTRDIRGVRPLFYNTDTSSDIMACSELKGLAGLSQHIRQFPPSHYLQVVVDATCGRVDTLCEYYNLRHKVKALTTITDESTALKQIHDSLHIAVKDRMFADRPIGALVSGGLDSSLIFGLLCQELYKHHKEHDTKHTIYAFTIGISDEESEDEGTDLKYARMVIDHVRSKYSDHLNIEFREIKLTYDEMWDSHKNTAWAIESFDVTTNRASIPQWRVSKSVCDESPCKVLFIGDGSDEVCGGYLCFGFAPSPEEFHEGNIDMLEEIHLYDVLRADRGIASNGLEARVPFLDYRFMETYLSVDPKLKLHSKERMEKYLLRKAFEEDDIIPLEVLWRRKEAFSDGVSSKKKGKSWFEFIQSKIDEMAEKGEFEPSVYMSLPYMPSPTKEASYFRHLFNTMFGDEYAECFKHYWVPLFQKTKGYHEPSARVLENYEST